MLRFCVIEMALVKILKPHSQFTYLDMSDWNGPLLRFFVNGSVMFPSEWTHLIFTVPSSTWSGMKWWCTPIRFLCWDADMFSDNNKPTTLSMCTMMGYSTTTPIKNKTTRINSIPQHISVISEYSDYITDIVTVFWLFKRQAMNTPLIRTIYPVTHFQVSLSPA